ncbi:MAG: ATP-binding protein [Candidatus Omnitrophica bacterium]|nr:ATP-binding protein [Candidatus Omnitrophota bacterium]MBU1852271.1 ATP-binding protein [Candidatus Omnitrophota bacterium]
MIKRIYDTLDDFISPNKCLIIYGARQVGKTTLLKTFLSDKKFKYRFDSGDNIRLQNVLSSQDFSKILEYARGYELLVIDEAQQIPNIGMGLKIIVDQIPGIKIIATGSSSFDLANQVGEPLTGRKRTLTLYPIAQKELLYHHNKFDLKQMLDDFLVFGSYPEVITANSRDEKIELLTELTNSYILKDILALERIKSSKILLDLLKLIAFQVGNLVSLNELANQLHIDIKTVSRYLDLLEKTFVITRLGGFSRNPRNEITNKSKYYFVDNGIRNAVISQFNPVDSRNDLGALWENFIIIERLKNRSYSNIYGSSYFWRNYNQKEIDLIEDRGGSLFARECKWSKTKRDSAPKDWKQKYPAADFMTITPDNYLDFIV